MTAMKRMDVYLVSNNSYDPMQSAYKINQATETAIGKLHNNIIRNFEQGDCTVLSSLDLSADFDTVDHNIFIARLKATFGIKDTTIEWISSYLTNCTQQVSINGTLFKDQNLECVVPQGSVLGAMMYIMYVYNLSKTICQHCIKAMLMTPRYVYIVTEMIYQSWQLYTNCNNVLLMFLYG